MPDNREWRDYRLHVISEVYELVTDAFFLLPMPYSGRSVRIRDELFKVLVTELHQANEEIRKARGKTMASGAD